MMLNFLNDFLDHKNTIDYSNFSISYNLFFISFIKLKKVLEYLMRNKFIIIIRIQNYIKINYNI